MPGQDKEAFSLTSTFIPQTASGGQQRNVLFGFLSAEADAGTEAGVKAEGYGKLRLLAIPRELSVPGPGQAQQNFDSNATVSQALNLLRQGASEVKNGNLLSLPVGGGILYVQPVYVQSSGQTSYPTLRKVLVAFGDRVGFADTLGEALDQVFEGTSGAVTSENGDGEGNGEEPGTPPATQTAEQQLSAALQAANAAITAGQAALAEGDFAKYGEEQAKLQDALERATEAQDALTGAAAPTDAPATDAPAPEAPASETPAP